MYNKLAAAVDEIVTVAAEEDVTIELNSYCYLMTRVMVRVRAVGVNDT